MKPEIFEKLAACGKYHNTGKVLIGLQHQRPLRRMTDDEIRVQNALLGARGPRFAFDRTIYAIAVIAVITLVAALAKIFK